MLNFEYLENRIANTCSKNPYFTGCDKTRVFNLWATRKRGFSIKH